MQISRLFEIVYILIEQKNITAKELAERFEVSQRTIMRDIEKLSMAGVPIYTTKGKGGGISIMDNYKMDKTVITEEEKNNILFGLQSIMATGHFEGSKTLSKLNALFGKEEKSWIEIDFSRWGKIEKDKDQFNIIKETILGGHGLLIKYVNYYGKTTERLIYPLKLIFKLGSWYIQGYCTLRRDYRIFKMSRIYSIEKTEEIAPKNLSMPLSIEENMFSDEKNISVTMVFSGEEFYRFCDDYLNENIIKIDKERKIITARLPDEEWLYGYLLSFGSSIEVLEPKEIRDKIKREIKKIGAKYF